MNKLSIADRSRIIRALVEGNSISSVVRMTGIAKTTILRLVVHRAEKITGTGGDGKAVVHGILQRGGKVKASVISDTKRKTIAPIIRSVVEPGSHVYTDSLKSYEGLSADYIHGVIDHAKEYVNGRIHTNGMENFWSLLKRAIKGTYVAVDAPHLGRYVDEEVFRFNEREQDDAGRFATVMQGVVGKRLMYKTLIGDGMEGRIADTGEESDSLLN